MHYFVCRYLATSLGTVELENSYREVMVMLSMCKAGFALGLLLLSNASYAGAYNNSPVTISNGSGGASATGSVTTLN